MRLTKSQALRAGLASTQGAPGAQGRSGCPEQSRPATKGPRRIASSPRAGSAAPCTDPVVVQLAGPVVAKDRARNDGRSNRLYTPDATARYAKRLRDQAMLAMRGKGAPMTGPVAARVVVSIEPPSSWSRRRKDRAIQGAIAPTVKPDFDNFQKNIYDALNGIVYCDDGQIVEATIRKVYAEQAGLEMTLTPIDAEPAYRRA